MKERTKLDKFLESQSYKKDFRDLMLGLEEKYGANLIEENGIGSQLDISNASKKFFKAMTTADVSVDANANVADKSVISHRIEIAKPFHLINSYYRLWKEIKKNRSKEYADWIIESQVTGRMYINDFTGFSSAQAYCFNYSTFDTAMMGIPSVFDGRGGSEPPKNLMSFLGQIELFSLIAGNSTLGATGLADLLIVISIYMDKMLQTMEDAHVKMSDEKSCWQYMESLLTGFIYRLNQPYRGSQSLFSNVSVYDNNFIDNMLDGDTYSLLIDDIKYSAKKENIQKAQEIYLDIMNNEMERKPITFPVTTACFSIDENNEVQDKDFAEFISEKNLKFGFINIYGGKSSTLSSCCFDKDQKVVAKSSNYGVFYDTFENIFNTKPYDDYKKNFTIFHNGSWVKGRLIQVPVGDKALYEITTTNNKKIIVTGDHINVTIAGDKPTIELSTEDYIAFNSRKLDSFPEKDLKLTYEQGFLIGLYLGDGSKYKRQDSESYEITFSLNETNKIDLPILKKALEQWEIDKELHIYWQHNTMLVKVCSKELYDIIGSYVEGSYAYEKELDMNILLQSVEFRTGITQGWYASDGGNSLRIYTTSKKLVEQGEALFTSLGINTIINCEDRTGENVGVIRGQEFNRNYPLYCLRWYDMKNKRSMGDVYKVKNNTEYFKIKDIHQVAYDSEYVYCFEMSNEEEPYFTLPNGVITHNCRLRSERDNEYFNSFGSGSTKIGSLGVATGNLPQLAKKVSTSENPQEEFLYRLKELVVDCQEVNRAKRNIISRTIKAGAQPLYSMGYMELKKQYSTFGVIGLYEALEILGYDIMTDEGYQYALRIMEVINTTNNELQSRFKAPHNVEQIPGENVAVKLAKKDRALGYNDKYELYSNQFIPLIKRVNMLDRIRLQGLFDKHFSGGAICHLNIDQEITDKETMKNLINSAIKQGVVYFAVNYLLKECENHHMFVGNVDKCPLCGGEIEGTYTRVVGFLTKVDNWIPERRTIDFPNRQFYGDVKI